MLHDFKNIFFIYICKQIIIIKNNKIKKIIKIMKIMKTMKIMKIIQIQKKKNYKYIIKNIQFNRKLIKIFKMMNFKNINFI